MELLICTQRFHTSDFNWCEVISQIPDPNTSQNIYWDVLGCIGMYWDAYISLIFKITCSSIKTWDIRTNPKTIPTEIPSIVIIYYYFFNIFLIIKTKVLIEIKLYLLRKRFNKKSQF